MDQFPQKLKELLDLFSMLSSEQERIDFLINYSDKFKENPDQIAQLTEENNVPFCESGVYVWANEQPDKTLKFYFAVNNPQGISAKALTVILDQTVSGEKPETILNIPDDLVFKIFGQNLSMGKNMGLSGIVQMVKRKARQSLNSDSSSSQV
jgi:cysteine desulfuration protein SufE